MSRINVMKPWLGEEEAAALSEVIASGWIAQGPRTAQFEAAFAERMETGHAVAASSCTTALHLALIVAGVSPGDDVVVPSFSFIATANAPTYVGARPVFADVDPRTGNLTAETVQAALTPATRAVIAVDQGGVPADLAPLRALCDPLGITVLEDAACAAGSRYAGRPAGAGAEIAAWSFHPRKILTTGEGGMLTTSNPDWAARARTLREHAMNLSAAERSASILAPAEAYTEVGYNYRMTDLQAAVGLVQLERLDAVVRRRRELAAGYAKAFAEIEFLRPVEDPPWGESNFQSYWIEVLPGFGTDRNGVLEALARQEISARRGIMAAHLEPAYRNRDTGTASLEATERLSAGTLILPLFHEMTESEQARVIETVAASGRKP
ncbi:DegT/DnrJ/EryC1/StrS family aminotransferase [Arthrobacter koreensis]|uniref:DegT/DnrJ/EryC1/StrS family aminotransferase n=1 Tax=Arthrobacter koreensis TaxID=199136 RepID=UPI002DB64977|nr:DegT/DnrJ/EryC1/StrS family aminotransferase [Arthrobacter koreensis]MEB7505209.1 DegT/DnrJ/EryC1/StrS family aminotransferase [Arthrobacter koreensis]